MSLTKTAIGLFGISIALIVIFLSFRKVGLPLFSDIGKGLGSAGDGLTNFFGDAGKGITDFFNSFDVSNNDNGNSNNSVERIPNPEPTIFVDNPKGEGSQLAPPPVTINPNDSIPDEIGGGGAGGFVVDNRFDTQSQAVKGASDFFGGVSMIPQNILSSITSFFTNGLVKTAFGEESQSQKISTTNKKTLENNNVQTGLDDGQQFKGGGESFIGGTVRKIPISATSTLGFIIDELGVSASEASDIRSRLKNDFGNFDFGTNTGSGQKGNSEKAKKDSLDERLRKEAEKSKLIFDSAGISNF